MVKREGVLCQRNSQCRTITTAKLKFVLLLPCPWIDLCNPGFLLRYSGRRRAGRGERRLDKVRHCTLGINAVCFVPLGACRHVPSDGVGRVVPTGVPNTLYGVTSAQLNRSDGHTEPEIGGQILPIVLTPPLDVPCELSAPG